MKATKKNLITYLKATIDNCHSVADYYKRNNDELNASKYIREASALRDILFCLQDDEYFEKQFNIIVKDK